jgi:hypothetical protein
VRAIVDFPVPASPLSQKIRLVSSPCAQFRISWRTSTLVSFKQRGSCSFLRELKAACVTVERRIGIFSSEILVHVKIDRQEVHIPEILVSISAMNFEKYSTSDK